MITSEISVAAAAAPPAPPSTWQQFKAMFLILVRAPKTMLVVLENQNRIAQAIATNAAVLNQLAARVEWYERRVPFIAKEYHAFKHAEKHAIEKVQAAADYEDRERRRAEMAVAQ